MDFAKKINELRAQKSEMTENAKKLIEEGKIEEVAVINNQLDGINNSIATLENLAAKSAEGAEPAKEITPDVKDEGKHLRLFNSLGEQLQAIRNASQGVQDNRLAKINDEVMGAGSQVGADGGFAIQTDFAGAILESAVQQSDLLNRVDSFTVSAGSNSAKWLMVDETDISTSVFGGVQMYWAAEGHSVAASKPKFKEMRMDLEKMMGFAYATDELLQDATFMSGFFGNAFTQATNRLLSAGVVSGDGNGKMTGILKSKALITVDKSTGQTAGSFSGQNVLDMWARADFRSRRNVVWLMHPDLETQLPTLTLPEGNDQKLIWMPEGGLSGAQYQTILGRPIIFDDNCSAIGNKGDVILADLSQYMLLKKGAAKQDWSMHVQFLSDQMCFRVVFRCNGAPKVNKALTIKNSANTRSPFVTLADRK